MNSSPAEQKSKTTVRKKKSRPSTQEQLTEELCSSRPATHRDAFGMPRDFLQNRFIYLTISSRAHGLSVGVNMNPDKHCDFDCIYCDADRESPGQDRMLDLEVMTDELQRTLELVRTGGLRKFPQYDVLPDELLELQQITLSGEGEPTLCPEFKEAVETVIHVRAMDPAQFFKIVLLTNGSGLHRPAVQEGVRLLTVQDEIWVKLDAGTQDYMDQINRPQIPLKKIMGNIAQLGSRRPIILQSLFATIKGIKPSPEEVDAYAQRLIELTTKGVQISLVQISSATRPTLNSECGHLPLKTLSAIAKTVREKTDLPVDVF